jgi:Holliday junction DNA helicase RuvA
MFAYIKGTLEYKMEGYVIVDVHGIGYKIFMSETGIEKLGNIGDTVKIHTYLKVREDDMSLFGFNIAEELSMFELLISVSGVGAKTALSMLSCIEPSKFALAVITNDLKTLTKIPGIGAKSAQRIVLELKDKLKTEKAVDTSENSEIAESIEKDNKLEDAVSALQVLGYNRKEIEKVFEKAELSDFSVEDLIKKGLQLLGRV